LSSWDTVGSILCLANLILALLIAAALPKSSKAGGAAAATIYLVVALASAIWIARSALWQQ